MADTGIKVATEEDFERFLTLANSTEGWVSQFDKDNCKVWDQQNKDSAINTVKLFAIFDGIQPEVMYDVLHDPEYRSTWDESMIEGTEIEKIDSNNDVGYYSAKIPVMGVSNRDFLNQRSWREKEGEFLIINHSVTHPKCPEKKDFVRAQSIQTGYLIQPHEKGCTVTYVTQTNPKGWIPAFVANKVTTKFAPQIVDKLTKAAKNYPEWKGKHNPDNKPWRKSE